MDSMKFEAETLKSSDFAFCIIHNSRSF